MLKTDRLVSPDHMVLAKEVAVIIARAIRSFWNGNYRQFRSQHWGGIPASRERGREGPLGSRGSYLHGDERSSVCGWNHAQDWVQTSINTGSVYTLQFGRWTEEDNNLGRTFKGWIDDFRVYSAAFTNQEVKDLYGNGG